MQSIFELKNELPFDQNIFDRMKKTASAILQTAEKNEYTQAIVLLSSTGKEDGAIINNALTDGQGDTQELLEQLRLKNDVAVHRILCLWQDGNIDIPSFAFRKMLCDLSPKNTETGIFVRMQNGFSTIKLEITMK